MNSDWVVDEWLQSLKWRLRGNMSEIDETVVDLERSFQLAFAEGRAVSSLQEFNMN